MQNGLGKMPNPFTFRKTLKFAPKKLWQTLKNFDDPIIHSI